MMKRLGIVRMGLLCAMTSLAAACSDSADQARPVAAAAPQPAGKVYVVVQRGQSLDQIARMFHVAKNEIVAANNLTAPYALKPGSILALPAAAAEAKNATAAASPAHSAAKPQRAVATHVPARPSRPKETKPDVIPLD